VRLSWQVVDEAGAPLSCAQGDVVGVSIGPWPYDFPCIRPDGLMEGVIDAIPAGRYQVSITLMNGSVVLYSTLREIDVPSRGLADLGVIGLVPPGVALFTWELRSMASGTPASCAADEQVMVDFGGGYRWVFGCAALQGTTDYIVHGTYSVMPTLFAGTQLRSSAATVLVTVPAGRTSPAYHLVFYVSP
jgi:hypothetical protein